MTRDLDALASARMECGIALLNERTPQAARDAIRYFDEAIDLRGRLPLAENPGFRYGLAGGWINRGDALTRLGGSENLADAVNSYTTAIELLKDLPASEDGLFVKRLAIAWMNRGIALEEQGSGSALAQAAHSFEKAIEALSQSHHAPDDGRNLVLASAWINFANALLRSEGEPPARPCATAEKALPLLADTESKELAAAEAGLKARHIVCQALVASLAVPSGDASTEADLIGRMTDTAEDALRLAQAWEKAGETRFRPLATQFFHLSTLVYEKHQTHFLAEFLLDHLDPERGTCFLPVSESWLAIGMETALRVLRRGCRLGDFAWLATPQGRRQLQTLKELEATEARLQSLRNSVLH